jgi:hypothetical protein
MVNLNSAAEGIVKIRVTNQLMFMIRSDPPGALRGPLRGASVSPLLQILPIRTDPPGALRGPLRGASV